VRCALARKRFIAHFWPSPRRRSSTLTGEVGGKRAHAGKIATGVGKVGHKATSDRIGSERHDNRNLACRALGGMFLGLKRAHGRAVVPAHCLAYRLIG
jgi:hypothetical protein